MADLPRLRPYARRGAAYYAELRAICTNIRNDLQADVAMRVTQAGKLTPRDILTLALQYKLTPAAMAACLEEIGVLACGVYDSLIERGFRPMVELRKIVNADGALD